MILADIDLPDAVFTNEFENSAMSQEIKHTEDGRKFVFLKRKNNSVDPIISCDWLTYAQLKQLRALRDNGTVTTLVLTDRTMTVLINSIKAVPVIEYAFYEDADEFSVTLNLTEV
jgi:hypothetical protein